MSKILLIDGMNVAYRAYYAHSQLSTSEGHSVSVIYGMTSIIHSIIKRFTPDKAIIIWDGKKRKERLKAVKGYKEHRKKQKSERMDYDDFISQVETTREMLDTLGIPQVHNQNMEADDYIYMLTLKNRKKFDEVIIVSTDKDFHQLLADNVSIWNDRKQRRVTKKNCKKLFGYSPKQTVDWLTFVGDKSDDIPGFPGIGEVKAKTFLEKFGSIDDYLISNKEMKGFDKKKLRKHKKLVRLMVDLRYFYREHLKGTKITYYSRRKPQLRDKSFVSLCDNYEIIALKQTHYIKVFANLYWKNK